MSRLEVTVLEKANGPLTKKIRLSANGDIHSDGAACALAHGRARRFGFDRLSEFSRLIEGFRDNQAITLGRLADGLPAMVDIVPKRRLNGAAAPAGAISRTLDFFGFRPGEFGFRCRPQSHAAGSRRADCPPWRGLAGIGLGGARSRPGGASRAGLDQRRVV